MKKTLGILLSLLLLFSACAKQPPKAVVQPDPQTKEDLLKRVVEAGKELKNGELKGHFNVEVGIPLMSEKKIELDLNVLFQKEPFASRGKVEFKTQEPLPMINLAERSFEFYLEPGKAWMKSPAQGDKWVVSEKQQKPIEDLALVSFFGFPTDEKGQQEALKMMEMQKKGDDYVLVLTGSEEIKKKVAQLGALAKNANTPEGVEIPEMALEDIQVESIIDGKTFLVKEHKVSLDMGLKSLFKISLKLQGNISYDKLNSAPAVETPQGLSR